VRALGESCCSADAMIDMYARLAAKWRAVTGQFGRVFLGHLGEEEVSCVLRLARSP
jgi:hypothetical protein